MAHGICVMNILQGAHGEHIVPLHDTASSQATYVHPKKCHTFLGPLEEMVH